VYPLYYVRTTVVCIFVLEYLITVSCISSYNSPVEFPQLLMVDDSSLKNYNVYPNPEHYYFSIPWYFVATHRTTARTDGLGI
jgi:hypothetical protein